MGIVGKNKGGAFWDYLGVRLDDQLFNYCGGLMPKRFFVNKK